MSKTVYFDHNATTPLHPELVKQCPHWINQWGNPSSIHWAGRGPKLALREARARLAVGLGCDPLELVFTSGGSEANNTVLKGLQPTKDRDQLIISAVEHPSVFRTASFLRTQGWQVDVVGVDRSGQLDLQDLNRKLGPKTALVSMMFANNETGHILPIRDVVREAHAVGALVHTDAVQALGKVPIDLHALEVDFASFSSHKFYSLKGCGLLYIRRGLNLNSLIVGGRQERSRRAGTENVLAIQAFGLMAGFLPEVREKNAQLNELRNYLESAVLARIPRVQVTGPEHLRLPNTSSLVIEGVDGETLLMNLDVKGFAVSTGAACSSGSPEPSPTLLAMGLTRREAQSSLRVSLGWFNTREEVDLFAHVLEEVVGRLREFSRSGDQPVDEVHYGL